MDTENYTEIAKGIVEGDIDIDGQIFEYMEDKGFFDQATQINLIKLCFEEFNFSSAEEFEDTFLEELEDEEGPLLSLLSGEE